VRRWRELVIGKNGEVLFNRSKATAGCSANGRRRIRRIFYQEYRRGDIFRIGWPVCVVERTGA
jgi:hypothetical protein